MADISKITLPSGTTYNIKDTEARAAIEGLVGGDAIIFVGVSSTAITDGGTERPTIDGSQVIPTKGQLFFYQTREFIWGADDKWHELGSLDSLGALAYKNNASGSYTPSGDVSTPTFTGSSTTSTGNFTPAGTVTVTTKSTSNKTATVSSTSGTTTYTPAGTISAPSFTGTAATINSNATYTPVGSVSAPTISVDTAGTTTTINNPTSSTVAKTVVAAAPGATAPANAITYYSVSDETLSLYQLGYTTGASITTSNVTVKTGDATYTASAPNFTGSEATISSSASYTPAGTNGVPTFTGTGAHLVTENIAVPNEYTATFTGTQESISVTGTPSGTISKPTFTGTEATISVS